jgi:hypothetical protein
MEMHSAQYLHYCRNFTTAHEHLARRAGSTSGAAGCASAEFWSLRRLLCRSRDDAAKRRMFTWLLEVDDAPLLRFGLTPEDIAIL